MNFLKTEILFVDFVLDNQAADVHALITTVENGGGGDQYQLIFYGQKMYKGKTDTLRFVTSPDATEFEERSMLSHYIKLGILPYINKSAQAGEITIGYKPKEQTKEEIRSGAASEDRWNYWVYRVGINGNINGDAVYNTTNFNGNLSANRTTDELKISFSVRAGKNKSTYEFDTPTGTTKIETDNDFYRFYHQLVKSINIHWSYGYDVGLSKSTFSNDKFTALFKPAVEYNFFPYSEVNNRFFTVRYGVDVRRNKYIDTTLFDKKQETLFGHGLTSNLSYNQKWGTTSVGLSYHNYLHNWQYFNIGLNAQVDVRIAGGLSFYMYAFGGIVRDQLSLPKGEATEQEILTRRRQLASGYNFYTSFGLNYRFGSKVNNFVNPRFTGGND